MLFRRPKTSAMVANIFKAGEDNDKRGKMPIYAASYVTFKDGTTVLGEGADYSLYDVMKLADANAYEANREALEAFYAAWEDPMKNWNFTNIGK